MIFFHLGVSAARKRPNSSALLGTISPLSVSMRERTSGMPRMVLIARLRRSTTGAGFCYNIGRIAAAIASVVFGWLAPVGDFRTALLWSSTLALGAAIATAWLPERTHEDEPA